MIVDLYAGAGGLDEGARLAGIGPVVGIDTWFDAVPPPLAAAVIAAVAGRPALAEVVNADG